MSLVQRLVARGLNLLYLDENPTGAPLPTTHPIIRALFLGIGFGGYSFSDEWPLPAEGFE